MKTRPEPMARNVQRRGVAEDRVRRAHPADRRGTTAPGPAHAREAAQRERIDGAFGAPAQRAAEDEDLQMKADPVQREVEEEDLLQGRFDPVQREALEEDLPAQGKFGALQRLGEDEEPLQGRSEPGAVLSNDAPAAGASGGLPEGLRSGVEALSGMDLSDVKVHSGSSKPAEINALAYTQGNDIHVAPGQEQHLAHEAWHVVQQRQGRVQPTMQIGDVDVNDDAGLEAEADRMGEQAARARGGA